MKKHVVCLTKAYNWGDTLTWLRYYDQLGYTIHLIDNESEFDSSTWFKDRPQHTYEKIDNIKDIPLRYALLLIKDFNSLLSILKQLST